MYDWWLVVKFFDDSQGVCIQSWNTWLQCTHQQQSNNMVSCDQACTKAVVKCNWSCAEAVVRMPQHFCSLVYFYLKTIHHVASLRSNNESPFFTLQRTTSVVTSNNVAKGHCTNTVVCCTKSRIIDLLNFYLPQKQLSTIYFLLLFYQAWAQ